MANKDNQGMSMLARVIQDRMKQAATHPTVIDIGQINGDLSLTTNIFPLPIPASDYLICRSISYNPAEELTATDGTDGMHPHGPSGGHSQYEGNGIHSHPDTEGMHTHAIPTPEKMRWVRPGDRVLVAWAGNDAVVIDIIVPAKTLEGGTV